MAEHEVHVVELQPLQRAVDRLPQILAIERVLFVRAVVEAPVELGRDDVGRAAPTGLSQHLAHDRLRPTVGVRLGIVEKVDAGVIGGRHALAGGVRAQLVAVGDPRAERKRAHLEPGGTQPAVSHCAHRWIGKAWSRRMRRRRIPARVRIAPAHCTHKEPAMPPSPSRGAIRRPTKRKPPLTLEALWQIKRIGTPTLSPSRHARLRGGNELRHGEERQQHVAVAVSDGTRRCPPRWFRQGAQAHGRRQGQRSEVVARRQVDRVHREAQGRRRATTLRHRARRRRSEAAHQGRHRMRGAEMVSRRQADRLRIVGLARSRDRGAPGQAEEGAQGRESEGARDRAAGVPFLGPLADRRPRAARLRLRRRDRALPRRAGAHRALSAAVGAFRGRLRHRAGRTRDRDHRRPRARAADDEPDRHRHRRSLLAAQARADRGHAYR